MTSFLFDVCRGLNIFGCKPLACRIFYHSEIHENFVNASLSFSLSLRILSFKRGSGFRHSHLVSRTQGNPKLLIITKLTSWLTKNSSEMLNLNSNWATKIQVPVHVNSEKFFSCLVYVVIFSNLSQIWRYAGSTKKLSGKEFTNFQNFH